MGLSLADRLATPTGRTALFYSTFYMSNAVANPFLPIWLKDLGIGPEQIGVINAVPIFLMIVLNLVVGRLADRAKDWRSVIVVGSCMAAVAPLLLFFARDYWLILVLWALVIIPFQGIGPVVDAATYRLARRTGANFGAMRVWGTLGFIAVTLVAGFLMDWRGPAAFLPLLAAVSLMRALASFQLPLLRGEDERGKASAAEPAAVNPLVATRLAHVWRPWFFLPLMGAALLHGSHMMQMGFGALIWQQAGMAGWVIGLLWAVAPLGEVLVMWFFEQITRRVGARHLILIACVGGAVRWAGFGLEPDPWVLAGLQLLHMVSFACAYVGIVNFIGNWTSENIAAQAQSFFSMLRQVVTVVALAGFGVLVARIGAGAYHIAAAMAAAGAVMVVVSLVMRSPRAER